MYGDCQVMQQQQATSSSMMMGGVVGNGSMVGMPMSMMSLPTSDPLFSPPSLGNPNHFGGFTASGMPPFHSFSSIIPKEELSMMRKEEEMESGSGSGQLEGVSCGEENDTTDQNQQLQQQQQLSQEQPPLLDAQGKKKRYHRHTVRQIQEMEALFKECPHPDDKQRMRLSQDLGLKPRQVKFWFQNRRTQMKAQQDRSDNVILRAENENLKSENYRLQAAIRNVVCPNCGGPAILGEMSLDEQHLRLENARLKEELERLSCIAGRYGGGGRPMPTMLPTPPPPPPLMLPSLDLDMGVYSRHFDDISHPHGDMIQQLMPDDGHTHHHHPQPPHDQLIPVSGGGGFFMEQDRALVLDLAVTAAEQLVRLCRANEPLWVRNGEAVDLAEHQKMFQSWPVDAKHQEQGGHRLEATKDSGHVMMNSITLVDAFLDVNKWMELFPSIVSTARTLQIINPGLSGNGNGSLHLMYAELQVLSPLVPTREAYFFRYCQQNAEDGLWIIVDFPAEGFQEAFQTNNSGYKRKPSGCVFQDMPNGYSMVTWVEQAEVDDKPVHPVFDKLVTSGVAFGARRWLSTLQQQCDRFASLMARNVSDLGVIPSPEARKNMMRLSQRMIRTFCSNISSSSGSAQQWTALSDSPTDTIRITTRKNTEPGQPNGVILSAVSAAWLPFTHLQVFELLTDEHRRSQLDVLSGGNSLHEVAHIANGSHQKNCVSLFRINASSNSSQNVELMLQESCTHATGGSLVVYATIDVDAVQVAMSGEDPSYIPLLPTGFVVLPAITAPSCIMTTTTNGSAVEGEDSRAAGCMLTVGIQVLASAVPSAKLNLSSVTAINNHLTNAVNQITSALGLASGSSCSALAAESSPAAAAAATSVSDH